MAWCERTAWCPLERLQLGHKAIRIERMKRRPEKNDNRRNKKWTPKNGGRADFKWNTKNENTYISKMTEKKWWPKNGGHPSENNE